MRYPLSISHVELKKLQDPGPWPSWRVSKLSTEKFGFDLVTFRSQHPFSSTLDLIIFYPQKRRRRKNSQDAGLILGLPASMHVIIIN